jgi:signal transduction histidine kinase
VVNGDRRLLRVLTENLLHNAWKATARTEGGHIEFARVRDDQGDAYHVRDNGLGFDMEHADRLFRPFERLHSEAEFGGKGLGLATVARIAARHGGKTSAEGTPGGGATFTFTLGREAHTKEKGRNDGDGG